MSVYSERIEIRIRDVSLRRTLRISSMLSMMQDAAAAHCEELGVGKKETFDRGLMWVIVRQHGEIFRMPECGETVTIESWPGETEFVFFPRYCRLLDAEGNILVSSSSLWSLADASSRSFAFPEKSGISVSGEARGCEFPLPGGIKLPQLPCAQSFTVPYSFVDPNGHMNNARYFDLAEDLIPETASSRNLAGFYAEYALESRLGETIDVAYGNDGDRYFFAGEGEKRRFALELRYR